MGDRDWLAVQEIDCRAFSIGQPTEHHIIHRVEQQFHVTQRDIVASKICGQPFKPTLHFYPSRPLGFLTQAIRIVKQSFLGPLQELAL
jgi:hypothetical protein